MKVINAKNKAHLLDELQSMKGRDSEIYVSLRPTMEIVHRILDNSPKIKRIVCPPSLYLQVSKKVFKYLRNRDIELQPGTFRVGRPMKHDIKVIKDVIDQRASGRPAKLIAENTGIPLRTVYFYLKNGLSE
jgi:hypothetical protein